jgi:hypothetical protein
MPFLSDRLKIKKAPSFAELLRLLLLIIIIAGLSYLGVLIYRHFHKPKENSGGVTSVQQYEKGTEGVTQAALQAKDYENYMNQQIFLASHYEASEDYQSAERVMNEVFTNVPAGKISIAAYEEMVNIEQKLGNTPKYKYYLGLLINQFKATGDTKSAADYQALLDKTK